MKICPKCRRRYEDTVDFCLRDGKPLVKFEGDHATSPSDVSSSAPEATAAEGESAEGRRPRPVLKTGVFRSLATGSPNLPPPPPDGGARKVLPTIQPWIPGQTKDIAVSGVRITSPVGANAPLPPWESRLAGSAPAPGKLVSAPPPPPMEEPPPPEPVVITPDLPLPPEVREEGELVGDETVLVVATEESVELDLELEPLAPPPVDMGVPLISRRTRGAALPRPSIPSSCMGPPVEEEPEVLPPRVAILTEDDVDPPVAGTDEEADDGFVVYAPSRRGLGQASARPGGKQASPLLLGMAAVVILGLVGLIIFVLMQQNGGSSASPGQTPAGSQSAPSAGGSASLPSTASLYPPIATSAPATATPAVVQASPPAPSAAPAPVAQPTPGPSSSGQASTPAVAKPTPVPQPVVVAQATPAPRATPKPVAQATPAPALPTTASFRVTSNPAGAQVFLDGKAVGVTPVTVTSAGGRHAIRVEKEGFEKLEKSVNVSLQRPEPVSLTLEAIKPPAEDIPVMFVSNQVGAAVFVDGNKVGASPVGAKLKPGTHALKVVSPDGQTKEESFVVSPANVSNGRIVKVVSF